MQTTTRGEQVTSDHPDVAEHILRSRMATAANTTATRLRAEARETENVPRPHLYETVLDIQDRAAIYRCDVEEPTIWQARAAAEVAWKANPQETLRVERELYPQYCS